MHKSAVNNYIWPDLLEELWRGLECINNYGGPYISGNLKP